MSRIGPAVLVASLVVATAASVVFCSLEFADFTDPVISGMSVFHCHLLNNDNKGMMAKILFE